MTSKIFLSALSRRFGITDDGHLNFSPKHAALLHAASTYMCREGRIPEIPTDEKKIDAFIEKHCPTTQKTKEALEEERCLISALVDWIQEQDEQFVTQTQVENALLLKLFSEREKESLLNDWDSAPLMDDCAVKRLAAQLRVPIFNFRAWNALGFHTLSVDRTSLNFSGYESCHMMVPLIQSEDLPNRSKEFAIRPGLTFVTWLLSGAFIAEKLLGKRSREE